MNISAIAGIAAAVGTILAAIALILNIGQFRRLDQSLRGNTYQQLAHYALELYKILLENPTIGYRDMQSGDQDSREQILFDRLLGNYLENVWLQRRYGLVDKELAAAYDGLVRGVLLHHPSVKRQMTGENYVQSLRDYIESMESNT